MTVEDTIRAIQEEYDIIGRERELRACLAALETNQHVMIEGPVGVGKTTLALAITRFLGKPFYRVDGDERYTEYKLVGHFDPPVVMEKGYSEESFMPGPLVQAMRSNGVLFVNEMNRMPEGTQNVILPAMDERQVVLPKLGQLTADDFLVVATQNPEEWVGTSRLSEALKDRFVWINLDYQSRDEEIKITRVRSGSDKEDIIEKAVDIARRTREHKDIRRGSSVRAAIDMVKLIEKLGTTRDDWEIAAEMALATRIEVEESSGRKLKEVIQEVVKSEFGESPKL